MQKASAVLSVNIAADGGDPITDKGVCWGTGDEPTIDDSNTNDGSGLGSFTSHLTLLTPGTTYFARAYAINSIGVAYGYQISFTTSFAAGTGPQVGVFPGGASYSAVGFSIGTKVYMGLGNNDGDWPKNDFWEWDQATNVWERKADFPGNTISRAVGFTIGTKGYIGTGHYISVNSYTNDFWEYDPETNSWTQKASFRATARVSAVGFSIGTKGYIGTGSRKHLSEMPDLYQDFWEWDQATNVWTKKADFGGDARVGAVGFSIGTKGYIGTGGDFTSSFKDFWEWDQATDVWTKKADFGGMERTGAVGFSIGNKGYIGTGYNYHDQTTYLYQDFWEWDQATNVWTQKADFAGGARTSAIGVSIGNKAYIGTGAGGNSTYAFQDLWEYNP